jgi:hypothetical protein
MPSPTIFRFEPFGPFGYRSPLLGGSEGLAEREVRVKLAACTFRTLPLSHPRLDSQCRIWERSCRENLTLGLHGVRRKLAEFPIVP